MTDWTACASSAVRAGEPARLFPSLRKVCVECYRVEQSIEQRDGVAVLEGLWPCPTARALDATQAGGES